MATNWIDKLLQSRKSVGGETWHYRIYRYWVNLTGGNPSYYKENLCHYTRVVVLWAPLNWFKYAEIYKFIRPWTIAYVILLALPMYLYIRAALELHLGLWQVVSLPLMYLVGIAGVIRASHYAWKEGDLDDERYNNENKGWYWMVRIAAPLAMLFQLIYWFFKGYGWPQITAAIEWTWDNLIDPWLTPVVRWYFQKNLGRGYITPFTLTLGVALVLATIRFTNIVLMVIEVIAGVVLAILLIWGVVKLIGLLREPVRQFVLSLPKPDRPARTKSLATKEPKVKHTSTWGLIATYFAALHRGVCPYIDLPTDEPTT